ncbi:DUF1295 domain-containing protein [archaeon]|nr:MAG: DUF1295 domain-containing protein [archaeon]
MSDRAERRKKRIWNSLQPFFTIAQTITVAYKLFKKIYDLYVEDEINEFCMIWVILCVISFIVWAIARLQLGQNLTFTASPGRALITGGIYRYFRNPIYYFSTLGLFSYAMMTEQYYILWLLLIIIPLQVVRALRERQVLLKKYDEDYEIYERKVWL